MTEILRLTIEVEWLGDEESQPPYEDVVDWVEGAVSHGDIYFFVDSRLRALPSEYTKNIIWDVS